MSNSLTDRVFKKGFRVSFNPRGDGNCFFEAAAHQMRQDGQKLKEATFKWLQINRYDETGSDRLDFVCEQDFRDKVKPSNWLETIEKLKDEFVTDLVVHAFAEAMHQEVTIVTMQGGEDDCVKVKHPSSGIIMGSIHLGHTGDGPHGHYVALCPISQKTLNKESSNQYPFAPYKRRKTWYRRANQMHEQWDDEDYCPGISVWKGIPIIIDSSSDDEPSSSKASSSGINLKREEEIEVTDLDRSSPKKHVTNHSSDSSSDELLMQSVFSDHSSQPSKYIHQSVSVIVDSDDDSDVQEAINRSHITRYTERRKRTKASSSKGGSSCQEESLSSDDADVEYNKPRRQRKIGPQQWDGVACQQVEKLPEGINGLCCYKVRKVTDAKERVASLKDGRSWKKDSRTEWSGYGQVRYANCKGSYQCTNDHCMYKVEYGVVNTVQFKKKEGQLICSLCQQQPSYIPCDARRYLVIKDSYVKVFHCGNHTCAVKSPPQSSVKEDIKEYLRKNPTAKPSHVQSAYILSMVRNREDWKKVDKQATELLNTKWISNRKQEVTKETEPYGHNFEAVAHFKQYCDLKDPFYIYKINDTRGNPDRPSFVFKTSTLKAKIAINMDMNKDHFLAREFCFFDGKHKRAKGYVTLTASVYHPLLRRQIPLATMEAVSENSENVTLFWELLNEVLKKVSNGTTSMFNPLGWCTDMAGSNLSAIRKVFGDSAIDRIKTCEFHFRESVNLRCRKISSDKATYFKDISIKLLECETPECYDTLKEQLLKLISGETEESQLKSWFNWWNSRRGFIFRAFAPSGPRMNQAESIHGGWAKKDPPSMTLLKVAEADVRESKLLDVEYEGIKAGTAKGGKGPTATERQRISHYREIEAAKRLGEEMFTDGRTIEEESSHKPPSASRNTNRKPTDSRQKNKGAGRQPTDTQQGARTESVPIPARPKPKFGAFVIGLLQHQHPSVRVCYGCGTELKPCGRIPDPPDDLVIIPVVLYHGSADERTRLRRKLNKLKAVDGHVSYPVVITSYEICMRDQKHIYNLMWKYLIVDEGHRIKNLNCKLIRELKTYQSANRLLLTGTPLQNNLSELWSLLNFLLPDIFDDLNSFQRWFDFSAINEKDGSKKIIAQEQEHQVLERLHAILTPFLLRRLKADVELDLPPKKEVLVYAPLTKRQQTFYKSTLDKTIVDIVGDTRESNKEQVELTSSGRPKRKCRVPVNYKIFDDHNIDLQSLVEYMEEEEAKKVRLQSCDIGPKKAEVTIKLTNILMQLRRCCNHPYLLEYPLDIATQHYRVDEDVVKTSGKMIVLDQLLSELKKRGHKVLLFSQMTKMLDIIEDYCYLRKYGFSRLDGSMSIKDRQEQIEAFNKDPDVFVFLLSTRAGGLGLNLSVADTVIIFDSDWNPQVDLQAQDRSHRIGQTKPVIIYRLITANSVDQKIVERAACKRKLEKMVIHKGKFKGKQVSGGVSAAELLELLESNDHDEIVKNEGILSKKDLQQLLDRSDMTTKGKKTSSRSQSVTDCKTFKVVEVSS